MSLSNDKKLSGTWLLFITFLALFSITLILIVVTITTGATASSSAMSGGVPLVNINEGEVSIISPLETNGGIPVNIQDQTTRPFAIHMNRILNTNLSLAATPTVDTYTVTMTTGHGLVVSDTIAFLQQDGMPQILFGKITNVAGDVITIDTPVPYAFDITKTVVFTFDKEINVDASSFPVVYGITNFFTESVDITRFIFHILDESAMDDAKFGSLPPLTNGIVLRKKLVNGDYINYWNVKSNGKFGELAYDKEYDAKAPAGYYGFTSRLTYAGQEKHGVAIRLDPGESIELVVYDDLSDLYHFAIMVEGHFVQD